MIQYLIFRICAFVWQRIPLAVGYRLAHFIADVTYFVWREKRAITIQNMRHVLGGKGGRPAAEKLARSSLRNYCKYLVDFLRFPRLKREDIERAVHFNGWEHFDRALQNGKGLIFIGLHMGNWDLGASYMALRKYPLNVIADTFKYPKLNEYIQGTREALGLRVIPMEQAAMKVLRVLRRNEVLAILIDRPAPEDGVQVRFFGADVSVPAGAALLSLKTGAPIIPGCLIRQDDDTYLGVVKEQIEFQPCGDAQSDIQALTQRIMDTMEEIIRQYPDQWYMFRPMWRGEVPVVAESSSFA